MNKYTLGMVLGRFQGLHRGHQYIIDTALEMCEKVLVFVGSAQKSGTKTDPFPYEVRAEMLKKVYGDSVIVRPLNDLGVGNVPRWGDYVIESAVHEVGMPDLIIYGAEDKCREWYKNYPNLKYVKVDRAEIPINASMLRAIIADGDEESFKKFTDEKIHGMYKTLREYIEKAV